MAKVLTEDAQRKSPGVMSACTGLGTCRRESCRKIVTGISLAAHFGCKPLRGEGCSPERPTKNERIPQKAQPADSAAELELYIQEDRVL